MNWKNILLQVCIIFISVFVSARLFIPAGGGTPPADQSLSEGIRLLSEQLQRIESQLNKMETGGAAQQTALPRNSGQSPRTDEIDQSLRSIKESLARLENRGVAPPTLNFPPNLMPPPGQGPASGPPIPSDPAAWIRELSADKRAKVEEVFNQHAENIRARLPQGGPPSDPETLKQIMKDSDRELRENLKQVLSESEYKKFLGSLPKLPE